jgi:3-deoxy-manno-octulosonate cytidylyltransferase (CMP-KDO synthetase)
MKPKVVAVIPARLDSSRFPGKALHPIHGRPLIYHVWKSVTKSKQIDQVYIATDSPEILKTASAFGADVYLSSRKPKTGSDRVAEVAKAIDADIYVNVQGDCFGISHTALDKVVTMVSTNKNIGIGTLAAPIKSDDDLFSPNLVKVVVDSKGRAHWFSRFPIPYVQHASSIPRWRQAKFYGHIGVYVFRREALLQFAGWKQTPCEVSESLEQLRILEHGGAIHICQTGQKPISIDSPEDARKVVLKYKKAG